MFFRDLKKLRFYFVAEQHCIMHRSYRHGNRNLEFFQGIHHKRNMGITYVGVMPTF